MKKFFALVVSLILILSLTACGGSDSSTDSAPASGASSADPAAKTEIVYGKSQGPYTELFEAAIVPILEEQGYTLKGVDFSDLLTADIALNDGDVDVNVEQHTAYAENFNSNNNGDLVPISPIPTVPAGIYSGTHTSLDEVTDGAKIAVPNDASNTARAYVLLQKIGWITLDSGVDPSAVTQDDIVENPKNLEFVEMKSLTIPAAIQDFDYVIITGSIVYNAGIDPSAALATEDILDHLILQVVVKEGNKNADWAQAIVDAYHSDRFKDIDDASEVAFQLDIPYEVLDFTMDFRNQIIGKFIRTYESGGTPNPCIDCNRYMKFDKLLRFADERGLEYVATGHYALIEYDEVSGRYLLKKALDDSKDQSYVLYMLTQNQLSHIQFPLGGKMKKEVREIAEQLGFCNAWKHDSQDICFVPNGDYVKFMEQYTGKHYPAGAFLDLEGQPVGRHCGAVRYTLGQRKGLGLAMGEPVYVCGKDMAANTVTVGPENALYSSMLLAEDMNWISIPQLKQPMRVKAKTRYRQAEQWAAVYPEQHGRVRLEFDAPQRAVTVGQAVVLYDGDVVVGGGTICQAPPTKR